MKYTSKELKSEPGTFAVFNRKGNFYPDTKTNNELQAKQDAICWNIRNLRDLQVKEWEKLVKISAKCKHGDEVYLEINKDENGEYSHKTNMGDLLA